MSVDNGERAYVYDANDERGWERKGKSNDKAQLNFYHGGKLLGEYNFADFKPKREYVQLGNHTIAQFEIGTTQCPGWLFADSFEGFTRPYGSTGSNSGEKLTYLYQDALGSTVAKADSTGNILWQENRLPYGKNTKLNNSQITDNPLQYTNAPLDTHSGLTYLKARYYNADIGRFYAIDQKWYDSEAPQSFGRYTYVSNNPYKYTDPTGLDKWSVVSKYEDYNNLPLSDAQGRVIAEIASMVL